MKTTVFILALLCTFSLGTAGYFLYDNNNMRTSLEERDSRLAELETALENQQISNESLVAELSTAAKTNEELSVSYSKVDEDRQRIAEEKQQLLKEKEEQLARTTEAHDQLVSKLKTEIRNHQIQIKQFGESVTVSMQNKILFPSGQAQLSAEGLDVLEKVGGILKMVQDKKIRVEGHTDNVPVSSGNRHDSNWELSAARALNVVRFLTDKTQVPAELLEAVALSEFHPVADNTNSKGRARNRRIEIMLQPLPADPVEEDPGAATR